MNFFHLDFKQVASHFDEDSITFKDNPQEYVQQLAKAKAEVLAPQFPHAILLTADTIVYKESKIYGKPKDEQEALHYLKELAGHWHSVFTGLTVYTQGHFLQKVEETRVLMNALTDEQMQMYHNVLAFADKAGGYMIQGAGSLIVKRIEGCYYNVVGLPINALCSLLHQAEIDLWKYLKRF